MSPEAADRIRGTWDDPYFQSGRHGGFSTDRYRRDSVQRPSVLGPSEVGWDPVTGMPYGPIPKGTLALRYQERAEAVARQREAALWNDAHRSMQLAEQGLTQYRNNAASVLRSGVYRDQAQLFANQAQTIEAPDLLGGFREEQRQAALRRARKDRQRAERTQLITSLVGVAASLVTSGIGGIAAAGAMAAAPKPDQPQPQPEPQPPGGPQPQPSGQLGFDTRPGSQPFGPLPMSGAIEQGQGSPAFGPQPLQGSQPLRLEGPRVPMGQGQSQMGGSIGQPAFGPQPAAGGPISMGGQQQGQGGFGAPGGSQALRGGQQKQGGSQGGQQGMGSPSVVQEAATIAYGHILDDDDTLSMFEEAVYARSRSIAAGVYVA